MMSASATAETLDVDCNTRRVLTLGLTSGERADSTLTMEDWERTVAMKCRGRAGGEVGGSEGEEAREVREVRMPERMAIPIVPVEELVIVLSMLR